MRRTLAILTFSLALAALVSGCSKCNPWWDSTPGACQSALPGQ